jgi:hypothetical protein
VRAASRLEVGGHHLPRPSVVAASWCPFQGSSSRRTGLYLIRGHNSPVTRSPYLVGAPSRLARPLDGTGDYCPALCAPGAVRGVFASQVRPDGVQGCPLGVRFRLRIGQVRLCDGYRFRASELLIPSALRTIRHLDTPDRHTGEHIGTAESVPSMTKGRYPRGGRYRPLWSGRLLGAPCDFLPQYRRRAK